MRRALAALALAVALPLPSLAPTPVHAQVAVRPGETLSEIAERHGVSLSRLMQANGISNPDHVEAGQTLVIPGGARGSTASRSGSASVTVQPGETLSEIAAREGVSMSQLMQANGLGNADLVMVGQRLVIPGRARSTAAAATPARAVPTAPYTVKSGETLSDIAARFDTTPERLIQINGLSNPDLLLAGSRLRIPSRPGSAAAPRSAASAREHVVSPGESLGAIAERYGTSVERLVALNNVENPDVVHAGTRLKLVGSPPAKTTSVKPVAKADPKPAPKPALQPTATPPTRTAAETSPAPAVQPKPTNAAATQAAPASAAPTSTAPTTAATATAKPANAAQPAQPAPTTSTQPASVAAAEPAVGPKTEASRPTPKAETKAETQPEPKVDTQIEAKPAQQPEPKPSRPTLASRGKASGVTTVASRTVSSRTVSSATTAAPAKESNHDWRSYGPLQVDWANWQPMGGSYVAPTLNSEGEPLYLAINCSARKVNATGQSGQWKTWDDPERDYEQKLVSDLCKAKGS